MNSEDRFRRNLSKPVPTLWLVIGLIFFTILVRAQTFNNPMLGYDEQFYLLVGDRMLHGALPFVDIFDRKPIGLFLIFAGIRELGGDGFLQYKLVACGFVIVTAYLIYHAALKLTNNFAAVTSALLMIIWLNLMEGEGGQAEIFYNLPMLAAALLVCRTYVTRQNIERSGAIAMLLVGIALQIKYTVIFEGIFFGCVLLWTLHSKQEHLRHLALPVLLWGGCALLPTGVALAYYWHAGQAQPFIFANFISMFGKSHKTGQWFGFFEICIILAPLLAMTYPSLRAKNPETRFFKMWLAVAIAGILIFGSFGTSHYGLPIILPATILASGLFVYPGRVVLRAVVVVSIFFTAAQIVLARVTYLKGGLREDIAIVKAATPTHGCIFIYDGYPALYMLTHSCLPTRWPFPSHLNTADEGSVHAIGIDPVFEVRRILATKPQVIVNDDPPYEGDDVATRTLVEQAIARDYDETFKLRTGEMRYRIVYRLKPALDQRAALPGTPH